MWKYSTQYFLNTFVHETLLACGVFYLQQSCWHSKSFRSLLIPKTRGRMLSQYLKTFDRQLTKDQPDNKVGFMCLRSRADNECQVLIFKSRRWRHDFLVHISISMARTERMYKKGLRIHREKVWGVELPRKTHQAPQWSPSSDVGVNSEGFSYHNL